MRPPTASAGDPVQTHAHTRPDDKKGDNRDGSVNAVRRRALVLLALVLVPLGLATAAGMVALWPDRPGGRAANPGVSPARNLTYPQATVQAITPYQCPAINQRPGPAGTQRMVTCASVSARLESGPERGATVTVDVPAEAYRAGMRAGDRIRVIRLFNHQAGPATYGFYDYARHLPIGLLAVAFAVVVIAVARVKGLAALIGLGLAYLVLIRFMLPALLGGASPLLVGLVGSAAIMFVVLYLAHGFSARTTTALTGTMFGLLATTGLGAWAAQAAHLTGLGDTEGVTLTALNGQVDLSGVIVCGIIVAGLGVLNDVTITQSSAVWELYELSPDRSARSLFASAMRIGRDHIASTVYTIAFAYAGAALPILLLVDAYDRPLLDVITSEQFAEEVIRTLVGSIGLVLAIPLTTAIAVAVVKAVGPTRRRLAAPAASGPEGSVS
jgi:uncharacterized membrane protein